MAIKGTRLKKEEDPTFTAVNPYVVSFKMYYHGPSDAVEEESPIGVCL